MTQHTYYQAVAARRADHNFHKNQALDARTVALRALIARFASQSAGRRASQPAPPRTACCAAC